jgi:uncharacterized membrane protein YgdD (TMEM256/DUF423 family)
MSSLLWRLGALNVAGSIIIQAAGGHKPWDEKVKGTFRTAAQLHMVSGIGLMLCSFKSLNIIAYISSILLVLGTVSFCGTGYYRCFTDSTKYNYLMPIGGSSMILGWLLMALL